MDKINKYKYSDHGDLDYFGISNTDNLFNVIDDAEYYKPILIKSSSENNYEYYEIKGDRNKKLSINQYLCIIIPHLSKLIGNKKNSSEYKIQLIMDINFINVNDKEKNTYLLCKK